MKSIVILISGRGSNLDAIVRSCALEAWPARIAAVISNRSSESGVELAQHAQIATHVVDERDSANAAIFEACLTERIDAYQPDVVVLAGFLRILSPHFVARYAGRILNIHPSLLPAFPGLGTSSNTVMERVNFVTAALDGGPIVAQAIVPVRRDDTESALATRVLALEHQLYPRVVRAFVEGRIWLEGEQVRVDEDWEPLLLCAEFDRHRV